MELNNPIGEWKFGRVVNKNTGKEEITTLAVNGDKFKMISVFTPDEGGKLGKAIVDNLMLLYEYQAKHNVQALPRLVLNDKTVPPDTGGVHSIGVGEISQGRPTIQIPPSKVMNFRFNKAVGIELTFANPDKDNGHDFEALEKAAIMLHEVNHAIHKFVNDGVFMQPNSSSTLHKLNQNLRMGVALGSAQIDHDYGRAMQDKKANEMETYWLSCCDAAKYNFSEDAITTIKSVNNLNLIAAGYSPATKQQRELLEKNINDKKRVADVIDINKENPTEYVPLNQQPFDEWMAEINPEGAN